MKLQTLRNDHKMNLWDNLETWKKLWRNSFFFFSHAYLSYWSLSKIKMDETWKCGESRSLRRWWENGMDVPMKGWQDGDCCDDIIVYLVCDGGHINPHVIK